MDSTNLRVKIFKKEKIKIPKSSKKEKAKVIHWQLFP